MFLVRLQALLQFVQIDLNERVSHIIYRVIASSYCVCVPRMN